MREGYTPTRYKLTIDDYHKLGEVGILNEDSRVELIEGELIQMAPIGSPHMWAVTNLTDLLVPAVRHVAYVSVQNPVVLSRYTEPQPDFTLIRRGARARRGVPNPEEVLLLVEVADMTLAYDRGTKLKLYARASIPEVWIVDVNNARIECYRQPGIDGYAVSNLAQGGDSIAPEAIPEASIPVASILAW